MSSEPNGVQAQMQRKFPAAYYCHCVTHRMSLSASQSATKFPTVAKFLAQLTNSLIFFIVVQNAQGNWGRTFQNLETRRGYH